MKITPEERAAWTKLIEDATPITKIVTAEDEAYDAMCDDDGFEYSCAVFDNHADALLFASAAPIIRQLLEENAELQARNQLPAADQIAGVGFNDRQADAFLHPGDWG